MVSRFPSARTTMGMLMLQVLNEGRANHGVGANLQFITTAKHDACRRSVPWIIELAAAWEDRTVFEVKIRRERWGAATLWEAISKSFRVYLYFLGKQKKITLVSWRVLWRITSICTTKSSKSVHVFEPEQETSLRVFFLLLLLLLFVHEMKRLILESSSTDFWALFRKFHWC